jgi:hypothetical protein
MYINKTPTPTTPKPFKALKVGDVFRRDSNGKMVAFIKTHAFLNNNGEKRNCVRLGTGGSYYTSPGVEVQVQKASLTINGKR